jgi:phosphoglycerate kinase
MQPGAEHLHRALDNPQRPLMAVVGGAKISTARSPQNLVEKVDVLVTARHGEHVRAQGYQIGKSLAEIDMRDIAKEIISDKVLCRATLWSPRRSAERSCRIEAINDVTPLRNDPRRRSAYHGLRKTRER